MRLGRLEYETRRKVRLLESLEDQEFEKKGVSVVRLPPLGPAFWQQREMKQMARRLGFSTQAHGWLRFCV